MMPYNTLMNKQLIKKLKDAYVTCSDCGDKYGTYSVGCSSMWEGKCDVCGETKIITETRDWGYFTTGIRKLTNEPHSHSQTQIKQGKEPFCQYDE